MNAVQSVEKQYHSKREKIVKENEEGNSIEIWRQNKAEQSNILSITHHCDNHIIYVSHS